jgi:two-component system, NarL family, nitrate/nitrite response regulator NarL
MTINPTPAYRSAAPSRPGNRAITVMIADDHPLFREGIARALRRDPALELVGEAADGREALALIAALAPDVAVLDVRMPELTGVAACAQLRLGPDPPRTAVLLLSAFDEPDLVKAGMNAGAAGYVTKTASHRAVCDAIVRAARGESVLAPELIRAVASGLPAHLGRA